MPRPAVLTQEKITAAALAVIDRDGLSTLTMRALGRELGVAAMSLYNHVADRVELENLVAAAVVSGIVTTPRAADPMAEVTRIMWALRDALNAHPEAIPLFLSRPTASETAMAPLDALLAALASAGFTEMTLLRAYHTLFGFLMGFVQADLTSPVSPGQPAALSEVAAGVLRLPESRFPHRRTLAAFAATSSSDAEFEYGLEAVLQGLTALAGRPQPSRRN
jgi:AcrR family transcriptional regulator